MTDAPQLLLAYHLKTLKLPTFLREYDKLARQCAAEGVDHVRYLIRLAELELIDRERRMVERRIRQAKFPAVKSLDSFDFKAISSLNKTLVLELARCEYVDRRENIIALGNTLAPEFCTNKQFNDGHLWANVNGEGNFNAMHTHPESILSGTVYLKFDGEEQGIIEFFDAREGSPTAHWQCYTQFEEKNLLTNDVYSVVPKEGDILFFPGWLKHWVSPNQSDEDRVSISFNMSIR